MTQPDLGFVHQFVPAKDSDSPVVLLLLHGTGGNEQDLLPIGMQLQPGAALLSPRGKVMENGMPRFFRRLAEGVFDVDDLRLMLLHPHLLAGAVLFRPMVPFTMDSTPDLRHAHVLLASGKRDPIVHPEQVDRLAAMFELAGADVTIYWHDGGHELGQDDLASAKNWLSQQSFSSHGKRHRHAGQQTT
jgi:predicted esterase